MKKVFSAVLILLVLLIFPYALSEELENLVIPIQEGASFTELSSLCPDAEINNEELTIQKKTITDDRMLLHGAMYLDNNTPYLMRTFILVNSYNDIKTYEDLLSNLVLQYGNQLSFYLSDHLDLEVIDYIDPHAMLNNSTRPFLCTWYDTSGCVISFKFTPNTEYYDLSYEARSWFDTDWDGAFAIEITRDYEESEMPYIHFCLDKGITIGNSKEAVLDRSPFPITEVSDSRIVGATTFLGESVLVELKLNDQGKVSRINIMFRDTSLGSYELERAYEKTGSKLKEYFGYANNTSQWIDNTLSGYLSSSSGFSFGDYKYSSVYTTINFSIVHEAYMKDGQSIHTISAITNDEYDLSILDSIF